jgi:hypothetical protein
MIAVFLPGLSVIMLTGRSVGWAMRFLLRVPGIVPPRTLAKEIAN